MVRLTTERYQEEDACATMDIMKMELILSASNVKLLVLSVLLEVMIIAKLVLLPSISLRVRAPATLLVETTPGLIALV